MNYNYICLINTFWDSATLNPLSTGQVSLYFALLHVCNRSNWTEWFQAPNRVLSVLTGLSRAGILRARNELKQRGMIDFKERGTKATVYKIVVNSRKDHVQVNATISNSTQNSTQNSMQDSTQNSMQDSMQDSTQNSMQNSTQNSMQDSTQNSMQNSTQNSMQDSSTLYKHKQKQNKTETKKDMPPISPVGKFDDFWLVYPNKQRRYLAETAYCDLILSGSVTEDDLIRAAKNYAEYIKESGDRMFLPNNFLEKCVFADYLEAKQAEPPKQADQKPEPEEEELIGEDWRDCETPFGR